MTRSLSPNGIVVFDWRRAGMSLAVLGLASSEHLELTTRL
jgi:hypothetical protein